MRAVSAFHCIRVGLDHLFRLVAVRVSDHEPCCGPQDDFTAFVIREAVNSAGGGEERHNSCNWSVDNASLARSGGFVKHFPRRMFQSQRQAPVKLRSDSHRVTHSQNFLSTIFTSHIDNN